MVSKEAQRAGLSFKTSPKAGLGFKTKAGLSFKTSPKAGLGFKIKAGPSFKTKDQNKGSKRSYLPLSVPVLYGGRLRTAARAGHRSPGFSL